MVMFNDSYIWKLYDDMLYIGEGTKIIPNTNYRIKELEPYHVIVQVEGLHKRKDGKIIARWQNTDDEYKVNILNSKEWDAMFD